MLDNSLYLSVLAGACTGIGALLLFVRRQWGNKSLAFFLGLASGVMIAVVVFDMMPSAFLFSAWKESFLGFGVGLIIMAVFNNLISLKNNGYDNLLGLGYLIMAGIALHDLPEGMAIALGDEMKNRTGMVIALGIGIHNIPEGMAIAAPLIMAGISKFKILFQILLLGLITPIGTLLGYLIISKLPYFLPLLLGIASGIMVYLVVFQLWPEARQRHYHNCWWGFGMGMLIIVLATYV